MEKSVASRLLRAGLLCGVVDMLWAMALTAIYQRPVGSVWPGVAATALGSGVPTSGVAAQALGLAVHFTVAFAWSALFLFFVLRSAWLRGILDSPYGAPKMAVVYGPLIWIVMSAVVIPLRVHRPLTITYRWWIQLAGHIVFVGLPITWSLRSDRGRR